MNNTLVMSIICTAIFLFHGVVYTVAWFQCGNGASEGGGEGKKE
jgi:hypothetical protein